MFSQRDGEGSIVCPGRWWGQNKPGQKHIERILQWGNSEFIYYCYNIQSPVYHYNQNNQINPE